MKQSHPASVTAFPSNKKKKCQCSKRVEKKKKKLYINYKKVHLREEGAPHYVDVTSSVTFSLLIISFILS